MKNAKGTIGEMQKIATSYGGKCLSKIYINSQHKLEFQCANKHRWSGWPMDIKRGHWCPKCAAVKRGVGLRLNIKEIIELASRRGGKLISTQYTNNRNKLEWGCASGHSWKASVHSVKDRGAWCPYCGQSFVLEHLCRLVFETIFKEGFPKKRPKWLRNSRGNLMEFDGYNEKLHIAFEYHGEQHYSSSSYFHKGNTNALKDRILDDKKKKELSTENNVNLIEIPHTIPVRSLYKYIVSECRKRKIIIPLHTKVDMEKLQSTYSNKSLESLRKIAESKGGKLLSIAYLGSHVSLNFSCKNGHKWKSTPHSIRRGGWCVACQGKLKHTITEMKQIASLQGGRCLSVKYVNNRSKLIWECKNKHTWEAVPGHVLQGHWCPTCAGSTVSTIEEMQLIAKQRGGLCLSKKYINSHTKLQWKCKNGHKWMAVPYSIKQGKWCQKCGYNWRTTRA